MVERPRDENGFGARFLATYRQLGGMSSVFAYATLTAIQAAGREGFDEQELAREVVEELKRQSASAIVLLLALGMGL